jgi:hypothetical protein
MCSGPGLALRQRFFNLPLITIVFKHKSSGELFVGFSPSGQLSANKQGESTDSGCPLPDASIMVSVTSILGPETADSGMTLMLKTNDHTLVKLASAAEIELNTKKTLRDDFSYLCFLGSSNAFEQYAYGSRQGCTSTTTTTSMLLFTTAKCAQLPVEFCFVGEIVEINLNLLHQLQRNCIISFFATLSSLETSSAKVDTALNVSNHENSLWERVNVKLNDQ